MLPRATFFRMALIAGAVSGAAIMTAVDADACACCGTFRVAGVAYDDVLNVRDGPGTAYRIRFGLAPDEGCIVPTGERRGNWVRIDAQGRNGWVNSRYLEYIP